MPRLSIRARLIGIALLFLLPIALQIGLFIDQSRKDITFADKEVDGVVYLRAAWPVLQHARRRRKRFHAAAGEPAQRRARAWRRRPPPTMPP